MKYEALEYFRNKRILKNDDDWTTAADLRHTIGGSRQGISRALMHLTRQAYLETQPVMRNGRPCLGYRHIADQRWPMALSAFELEHKHKAKRKLAEKIGWHYVKHH